MSLPIFTIGHSNHSLAAFAALLQQAGVTLLVDVRTIPRSRYNPQFNIEALPVSLADYQIGYHHLAVLGGKRHSARDAPPSPNGFWESSGFQAYADYAMTTGFRAGLAELLALQKKHPCAIMCAEADWRNCHRRLITDNLIANGQAVRHITANGAIEDAAIMKQARIQDDGTLLYPPETLSFPF